LKTIFSLAETSALRFLAFMKAESGTIWWIPIIDPILSHLRICAHTADSIHGDDTPYMSQLPETLNKFISIINMDRESWDKSKKQALLTVVNQNLKVFFDLNSVRLCGGLIKQVSTGFPDLSIFPKAHTITYYYYLGRISLNEEKYQDAFEYLSAAYASLPIKSRNKSLSTAASRALPRVLALLVPLRLILGKPVSAAAVEELGFEQYGMLARAVGRGDVGMYQECLNRYEGQFIEWGVLLVVEQLRLLVFRRLFHRIYEKYVKVYNSEKSQNLLLFSVLSAALTVMGVTDVDGEELECIAANLIFKNWMRGYIARGKCIVLSKKTPFP
jgi:hypothetical protein